MVHSSLHMTLYTWPLKNSPGITITYVQFVWTMHAFTIEQDCDQYTIVLKSNWISLYYSPSHLSFVDWHPPSLLLECQRTQWTAALESQRWREGGESRGKEWLGRERQQSPTFDHPGGEGRNECGCSNIRTNKTAIKQRKAGYFFANTGKRGMLWGRDFINTQSACPSPILPTV